jgi:hypothetical protein
MRYTSLLPFSALLAITMGCGSEPREKPVRSVAKRDLTLVSQTPQLQIASRVETAQLPTRRTVRLSPAAARPTAVSRFRSPEPQVHLASITLPAIVVATPQPLPEPTATAAPVDDRELPPGKTVTLIPASSGPSIDTDRTDELPSIAGAPMAEPGGGRCGGRGRGPGIGIAGAPRPDFR